MTPGAKATNVAPTFSAYKEHSLDMGTFTAAASSHLFDWENSVAMLRIGRIGDAAWLELRSDGPSPGGVFDWNPGTQELRIDLPASVFDAPSVGQYHYQLTIISAAGVRQAPPLIGTVRLGPVVFAPN